MRYVIAIFVFAVVAVVSLAGFRGTKFTRPPLFIFPDMEWQKRYSTQGENEFFPDKRDDRPVVAGTVQRGYGWAEKEVFAGNYQYPAAEYPALFSGRKPDGSWYAGFPVHVDAAFLELGHQKFDIFCAVCHGQTGDGNGITKVGYGMITVRNLMEPYVSTQPEGELFSTISYGHGKMGPYGDRLAPAERWAVIAYLRALELAGNATIKDVPSDKIGKIGQ
jgi:mono/diheme cytochrome c family protein